MSITCPTAPPATSDLMIAVVWWLSGGSFFALAFSTFSVILLSWLSTDFFFVPVLVQLSVVECCQQLQGECFLFSSGVGLLCNAQLLSW